MGLKTTGVEITYPTQGSLRKRYFPNSFSVQGKCENNISGFEISFDQTTYIDLAAIPDIHNLNLSCASNGTFSFDINSFYSFANSKVPVPLPSEEQRLKQAINFWIRGYSERSDTYLVSLSVQPLPDNLTPALLISPLTSPGSDPRPVFRFSDVEAGDSVTLYSDAACTSALSLIGVSISDKLDLQINTLSLEGSYAIYGKLVDQKGKIYPCTPAPIASYDYKLPVTDMIGNFALSISQANKINLSWTPAMSGDKYTIYRKGVGDSDWTAIKVITSLETSSHTDSDSNFAGGMQLYYKLGVSKGSQERVTSELSATIIGPVYLNITTPGGHQVSLGWSAVAGARSYEVYQLKPGDSNYGLYGTTEKTNFTVQDTYPSFVYNFYIKAINANGGVVSNIQTGVPLHKGQLAAQYFGGGNGYLKFDTGVSISSNEGAYALDFDANGDIYVAGEIEFLINATNGFVRKLNYKGDYLDSFAANSSSFDFTTDPFLPTIESFRSLAIIDTNKLLVGGFSGPSSSQVRNTTWKLDNGTLANSYWDTAGALVGDPLITYRDFVVRTFYDSSTKSVYNCVSSFDEEPDGGVYKLTRNENEKMAPDLNWGTFATLPNGDVVRKGRATIQIPTKKIRIRDCAWDSSTKETYVMGSVIDTTNTSYHKIFLTRLTADGQIDPNFGDHGFDVMGFKEQALESNTTPHLNRLLYNGTNLVITGSSFTSPASNRPDLWMFTKNGFFIGNGGSKYTWRDPSIDIGEIYSGTFDEYDRNILFVSGTAQMGAKKNMTVWKLRMTEGGFSLDSSFATQGRFSTDQSGLLGDYNNGLDIKMHPLKHFLYVVGQVGQFNAPLPDCNPFIWAIF